jgi:hypothetical protein
MFDQRLLGTWVSDRKRTAADIAARRDISSAKRAALLRLFGKLRLRMTRTHCHSTLGTSTDTFAYRVVAKNSDGVVVVARSLPKWATNEEQIQHIRFESPELYWICLGPFREYFRKVHRRPNNAGKPKRHAHNRRPTR